MSKTVSVPKLIIVVGFIEALILDAFTDTKNSDLYLFLIAASALSVAIKYVWRNDA
jgi:hypothetical protein